jgi:4-amino-4-deoxy-L-arabinose transferase-like glycosyltransferase
MPRIIEIVLFLAPLLTFVAWRVLFPSPTPPPALMYGLIGFVVCLLVSLIWIRQVDVNDRNHPYHPDELHDGRVVRGSP